MTQSKNQMEKMAQDAASFGREGVEAYIKSSTLWMKGCEDIMRTAMSLAQSSAEKQGKFVKEALSSKTLNEWAEVQNKIAQNNFDDFMAGATKLSELSVKVLSECTEPVNSQASKAVKKVTEAMAA
ncbi:MAG: phasin family protein [Alphaproteobacteria bacterium]|nr:phasin family protein [Alphaproteobacteria bacterium]MCD8571578.1 phasin family protein [Alphaproteobacteria bacterium]